MSKQPNYSDEIKKADERALEYKSNNDGRQGLNEGFRDAFEALKLRDYEGYLKQANILAKTFNVSRNTVGKWLNGSQDFVGKGNPRRIGNQSQELDGEKAYKMRVAYAKAVILGQYLEKDIQIETKKVEIKVDNVGESGKKLREYLANDYTRTRGVRLTIGSAVTTWEYARYNKYPDEDESTEVSDWSGTLDSWNPGIELEDSFPWEDVI